MEIVHTTYVYQRRMKDFKKIVKNPSIETDIYVAAISLYGRSE